MTGINWNLSGANQGFMNSLRLGMEMGGAAREAKGRREYRSALADLANDPENQNALAVVFQHDPRMRRRGYKPAENSAHLDGAALDLVPPRGKSMRWLMEQVERVEPGADMLPEGDHLHVIFPDWQGAPALGNARSAGLINPASM